MKKYITTFILLAVLLPETYSQYKGDKATIKKIKAAVSYLASDELEGRRTATKGEQLAAEYLVDYYKKKNIQPYHQNYILPFDFVYGMIPAKNSTLTINNQELVMYEDYYPLPFSADTKQALNKQVIPEILETDNIWVVPLYGAKENAENAHWDVENEIAQKAKHANAKGAKAVIFYDEYGSKYFPAYNRKSEINTLEIPVLLVNNMTYKKHIAATSLLEISLFVAIDKKQKKGRNVAAYINNNAPYTVVLGAHYDHLGYGEDGNSTYRGEGKMIHNGADDNASGTVGLMELASWIKEEKLKNYNYLFIHFSGEELGLLGSKAVAEQLHLDSTTIAYMINMDMIGRLNDSTHALTVGGVGTSPAWSKWVNNDDRYFKIKTDSSGVGPSDHTSFYHKGIPVLFFFTGLHHDYHKPSDDAEKVNYEGMLNTIKYIYNIVEIMDDQPKPVFTPTKQKTIRSVRFKVTMGIMPDYSYSEGDGIRVDGVSEDRPAIKAGVKAGDIITQIGKHEVNGMQSYMEALSKFEKGDKTSVKVKRSGEIKEMELKFD